MTDRVNPIAETNTSATFLPRIYRTDANKKFLQATVEQLTQRGSVSKLNGYIGRQNSKASTGDDIFLAAISDDRKNYQLEPSVTIEDKYGENIFFRDYQDYINKISLMGGDVSNHSRLNSAEYYSWDPRISWDRFVNFRNYFWNAPIILPESEAAVINGASEYILPDGSLLKDGMILAFRGDNAPAAVWKSQYYVQEVGYSIKLIDWSIVINGSPKSQVSTYDVSTTSVGNTVQYVFSPDGISTNPVITLYRGQMYTFRISTPGYPMSIMTAYSSNSADRYDASNTNYRIANGEITLVVTPDTPSTLYYLCETDITVGGVIQIEIANQYINVEDEILGKTSYTLSNGVSLSNGMLVSFDSTIGTVEPISYISSAYYVDGVGESIRLTDAFLLSVDNTVPDYILINRTSTDRNAWSLSNYWVHEDVINTSAAVNQFPPILSQGNRASRPIIEFNANLKLFNYGDVSIDNIDVIDSHTTDVFSTVEGSHGYNVDGIQISAGYRVIFTADTDTRVKDKIFEVQIVNSLIHLVVVESPLTGQVAVVKYGTINAGKRYWYNGYEWAMAQEKLSANVPPLFNVYDSNGVSIGDLSSYPGSSFTGTKVFSYKIGSGSNDIELGFPLSYKNISNIGDIVFNFDFSIDTFTYKSGDVIVGDNISKYFLHASNISGDTTISNGWVVANTNSLQAAVRIFKNSSLTTSFPLDIYDDMSNLSDLDVRVYINGIRLSRHVDSLISNWIIVDGTRYKTIVLLNPLSVNYATGIDTITNLISTRDTSALSVGDIVVFNESTDSIIANRVYYINDVASLTEFSISETNNGATLEFGGSFVPVQFQLSGQIDATDILTVRSFAKQVINANGFYEIPINLQNNPKNETASDFTLGEVVNHVETMVDNLPDAFVGDFPGIGNLRDLPDVGKYGTKVVRHSGPFCMGIHQLTSDTADIITSITRSRDDYGRFKRTFIATSSLVDSTDDIKLQVDAILRHITKNIPGNGSYNFSDMIAFGASIKSEYIVTDYLISQYALHTPFSLDILSNRAVNVYVNGSQLLHEHDYRFDAQGFLEITSVLEAGDKVTIHEYDNTDGCFIPETPTKLGLWPKYDPKLYKDTSFVTPRWIIQGHDGSQVLAYGDYDINGTADIRDLLILELEKRIYNNLKTTYDADKFDIDSVIPRYGVDTAYTITEFNNIIAPHFYNWSSNVDIDFAEHIGFNDSDSFTFNYSDYDFLSGDVTPGYWRGVYRWVLGTDRPHICPWEMLGMVEKPVWWDQVYGPAPYSSDNLLLWTDIRDGAINNPNSSRIKVTKYAKPFIMAHIPVDSDGALKSPLTAGYLSGNPITNRKEFVFGDVGPVENAWRRSSHFQFSVIGAAVLMFPAKAISVLFDTSRIKRNVCGQLVYIPTGTHISSNDIILPSVHESETRVQTAGLVNYIINRVSGDNLALYNAYVYEIYNLNFQLSYRAAAFTSKSKFNLLIDSNSPHSKNSVFIPQDDYYLKLNTAVATKKITYSGVIISKLPGKFSVRGYSKTQSYFKYYNWSQPGIPVTIGGISEKFVTWTSGQSYQAGQIIKVGGEYYRTQVNIGHSTTITSPEYVKLTEIPTIGGKSAFIRREWDKSSINTIPYNTSFESIQEVVDFLLGYGEWLKDQGFIFDDYNSNINNILNWETSAKEFLFWTTQNWSSGKDVWTEWTPNTAVKYDNIVVYNGDYFKAIRNIDPSLTFNEAYYVKLDGLSTVGSSVISLSPGAIKLSFSTPMHVVDDISNPMNDYEIYRVDGEVINPSSLSSIREGNLVSYSPTNDDGIYNASFYLVQKEHVVILNNTTQFNDLIYSPVSGYKQDRLKVSAYVSSEWYGGMDIKGFIFDEATVVKWQKWSDYRLGDVVQHQSLYYCAKAAVNGTETFEPSYWINIAKKPTSKIIPNWTNLATQIEDFYDLETDSFDNAQQVMAQHLIGYQKRQYLDNIIQDDVSEFKFFQGMIVEKGTANVLNKLFNVLGAANGETVSFAEEWMVRTGQYGACAAFDEIELVLDQAIIKNNPQGIELVNSRTRENDYIIQQTPSDVYVKPLNYMSTIAPVASKNNSLLRSAGYVRSSDVYITISAMSALEAYDVSSFSEGKYVWCTFVDTAWNVYRYTDISAAVTAVVFDTATKVLSLTFTSILTLSVGEYIGISSSIAGVINLSGVYKIASQSSSTYEIHGVTKSITIPTTVTDFSSISISKFKTQRVDSMDNASDVIYPILPNELLWADDDGTGKWACWKNTPVFNNYVISSPAIGSNSKFGSVIESDATGDSVAIGTSIDEILIYKKVGPVARQLVQRIAKPAHLPSGTFGKAISISSDGVWMAVGTPDVSNALATSWSGRSFDSVIASFDNISHDFSDNNTGTTHVTYDVITADASGSALSFTNHGVVTLYRKDKSGKYSEISTFISPQAADDEAFGTSLAFGDDVLGDAVLYVGAPGHVQSSVTTGKVYKIKHKTLSNTSATYVAEGSSGVTVKLSGTTTIASGMFLVGNGFYNNQQVLNVVDDSTIIINMLPDSAPSGTINFVSFSWEYSPDIENLSVVNSSHIGLGSSMVMSNDKSSLAVGASERIYTYSAIGNDVVDVPSSTTMALAISTDGTYLVMADHAFNLVRVYLRSATGQYDSYQVIKRQYPVLFSHFGIHVGFIDDDSSLVIHGGYTNTDSGHIEIYDRYNTKWIYSERLAMPASNPLLENDSTPLGFAVTATSVLVGEPTDNSNRGVVTEFYKKLNTHAWRVLHNECASPDVYKIKKAFLYDRKSNQLIEHLDVVDPLQGKFPGPADAEISFRHFYDPAIYSVGNSAYVNVDSSVSWASENVGKLWWDLRSAKFIDSHDSDVIYRTSTWNTLAEGASIDIYEWVEYSNKPSVWDSFADTVTGLANNISGISLYGDTAYSEKTWFDTISKTYKSTYYFWVKNKTITPDIQSRHISAASVSNLIADPAGSGYRSLSVSGVNSLLLTNVASVLSNTDVILSLQTWNIENTSQNTHDQWKLISNDGLTGIPDVIEQKWFDSLCGFDTNGRVVPDPSLPDKLRYGVENRPRQGMFVNRAEALKEFVDQINTVLQKNQISYTRDLTLLSSYDEYPAVSSKLYDISVDTEVELQFISTRSLQQAILKPIIVNGKITSVTIINPGVGYINYPNISIIGNGSGAILSMSMNQAGQITSVDVISGGNDYNENTVLIVRLFSVLVYNDSTINGNWGIYTFSNETLSWSRILTKSYDTRDFWSYIDWYATGYSQFTNADFLIDSMSDLQRSTYLTGDVIKVRVDNNGGWLLLLRNEVQNGLSWDKLYDTIGVQNGTIQLGTNLYSSYAYDGLLYDSTGFDNVAGVEIRNILSAVKNNILINELSPEYANLFFNSVRYVFSEQNYVDWVTKSSFIKAKHKVGDLHQSVTFKNDHLEDFESYVAEVKPYRTKVREYISEYSKVDIGRINTSDFDLPAVYNDGNNYVIDAWVENDKLKYSDLIFKQYPWKSWADNAGFSVTSINIVTKGYAYYYPPKVYIIGGGGTGASAVANLTGEYVSSISIVTPGSNYLSPPTIVIDAPPHQTAPDATATAVAYIGNTVVRTNLIGLKFDRITSKYYVPELAFTETIVASSNPDKAYDLVWAPDIKIGNTTVLINGVLLPSTEYTMSKSVFKKELTISSIYDRWYGVIEFTTAPPENAVINVSYLKDISLLNAADRIQYFYSNDSVDELGKDLAQLMTGVDYGGVLVDGISFNEYGGWDVLPFLSDRWDSYDPSFTDFTITIDEVTHSLQLPYIPSPAMKINVYHNSIRLDDENFGTTAPLVNMSAIMATPIGISTIAIPDAHTVNVGDVFILRQSTSDGSKAPDAQDYDVSYSGGDLSYTSAVGFSPEDLIIDGDAFVTPMTSYAPEEVVPGQLVDSVAIKVFEMPSSITGNIKVQKYLSDAVQTTFAVGEELNSAQSLFVTLTSQTMNVAGDLVDEHVIQTADTDYTVDFAKSTVTFTSAPVINTVISIFSIGVNATDVLDIGYTTGDGASNLVSTKLMWSDIGPRLALAEINGRPVNCTITEINYVLYLVLSETPAYGDFVSYMVVESSVRTFTLTTKQTLLGNGGLTYALSNISGDTLPNNSFIVRVDQSILKSDEYSVTSASSGSAATITFVNPIFNTQVVEVFSSYINNILGIETESVDVTPVILPTLNTVEYFYNQEVKSGIIKLSHEVLNENYLWVVKNDVLLTPVIDFIINDDHQSIKLKKKPKNSDKFKTLTFASNLNQTIAYMQFKDMLNRVHYKDIDVNKQAKLTAPLFWNDLVIHVDNTDVFDIPEPAKNIPGVIEIGAERIEYFVIYENTLTNLRRATLGTGAADRYDIGKVVQNIGPSSNIPYHDSMITEQVTVTKSMIDNGNLLPVGFIPPRYTVPVTELIIGQSYEILTMGNTTQEIWTALGVINTPAPGVVFTATGKDITGTTGITYPAWTYDSGFTSFIPSGYGQVNAVEVFIGGYNIVSWMPKTVFAVGDIIMFGSYLYSCLSNFISGDVFSELVYIVDIPTDGTMPIIPTDATPVDPLTILDFFVESVRLKNKPYKVHNVNVHPYSPMGDIQFDADFSVNGTTSYIRLTKPVPEGTIVTVVRNTGSNWANTKYYINLN